MSEAENSGEKTRSANLFPVVGVGASAGGLDAFKRLIGAIPSDSGMAYILVQHLDPNHPSLLSELLQKKTSIPVVEITDNVHVEPNHIYVIPSNKLLMANDGVLKLSDRPLDQRNMPIDLFFISLAEVHQAQAIGVVLSGHGSDGTIGIKAIRDSGGITIAQDQQSAVFDSMPKSAIDADLIDFVLIPEEMPLRLSKLNEQLEVKATSSSTEDASQKEQSYRQLFNMLKLRKGTDFTYYKQTTVRRRIIRRMALNKIENIRDYLTFFREHSEEQDTLYQDLLIPVTDFFRDPNVYATIGEKLLPLLFQGRDESKALRIWIAGCSTGQEPYSFAMMIDEYLGERAPDFKVQIFASDLSENYIAKARAGIYTKKEVLNITPARLEKYFTRLNGGHHVNKTIRDMCVFAVHNFLKDPPYARMDLVSSRNVLIYMEPFLQKRALTTFHYALKDNGFLIMGRSETSGQVPDLFSPLNEYARIYSRKAFPRKFLYELGSSDSGQEQLKQFNAHHQPLKEDFQKSADEYLLATFSPPGVVVNGEMDIVQFRGATGRWLEPQPGKPSLNLLKMAKDGLSFELRTALNKVQSTKMPVTKDIAMRLDDKKIYVNIEVLLLPNTAEPHFLVLFRNSEIKHEEKNGQMDGLTDKVSGRAETAEAYIKKLEAEIKQFRDDMRDVAEEQDTITEELQSANEELLSGSEELQSLNEELETSKEEIQSTNEELTTLNQELIDRNDQLKLAALYAESIVRTVRQPLIIINTNLKVRTANSAYYAKFKTNEEQTEDRQFYEIGDRQWDTPLLKSTIEEITHTVEEIKDLEITHSFRNLGKRTMLINASRIFRMDKTEQLILLAIEDITDKKKVEAERESFTNELERTVRMRTIALRQSNENLERFATIASHDLQEPLRKIRTFSSILNKKFGKDLAEGAKEMLSKIDFAADRMSKLIKDVLNFSRVLDATGFEVTDLNTILDNVLGDFELIIEEKKAVITRDSLPLIEAVPLQINQLFYNLLGNSLKYSREEIAPTIRIGLSWLTVDEVKMRPGLNAELIYFDITFSDNGIGFDPQFAKQIFLLFQRLNSQQKFEGTGIGLALCKKTVLAHHGEIYADAIEGQGAIFHVILPTKQR